MKRTIFFLLPYLILQWAGVIYGQSEIPEGLAFQAITDLDGSVWLATAKGAIHIEKDGIVNRYDKSKGLNDDMVMQVVVDPDGTKWFIHSGNLKVGGIGGLSGAWANGVSHLKKDGTIEIFTYNKGLPTGMVFCIAFDIDGSRWFGTFDGVVHMKSDGTTKVIDSKDGLPNDRVRSILVDKDGQKWFATENGIARMEHNGQITTVK